MMQSFTNTLVIFASRAHASQWLEHLDVRISYDFYSDCG